MEDQSHLPAVLRKQLPSNLQKIRNGHYTKDDEDYPVYLYLKENDISVEENGSEIIQFLRGRNILVTGATGFLGKLLVEKLLRCCKDIGTIYVIVRTKKGKDPEIRIKEFLDNWVFYRLSEIYPNYRDKVVGISANFEEEGMGLTKTSRELLKENVNIIYHVAATVRFDEPLKKSIKINVGGTLDVIKLAKECKKLDVFVHVSTAFSNCNEENIKEQIYPPYINPDTLLKMIVDLPADVLERITLGLLGNVPNTYVFTKQIAEALVNKEAKEIPVCIFRPSVVIASVKEPVKSWVDNIYGPVGLIHGGVLGIMHVVYADPKAKCDIVPVDYVINACIVSSYKTTLLWQKNKIPIFNFTASKNNQLYWKNIHLAIDQGEKVGSAQILMAGFCVITSNYYLYQLFRFWLHLIPAYIVDFILFIFGKQPILKKAYAKIHKFGKVLEKFTLNEFSFERTNTVKLWEELNSVDKKNFPFDLESINWPDYFDTYLVCMREFLTKEFLDNLDAGRRHKKMVDVVFYTMLPIIIICSVYYLMNTIFCFVPLTIIGIFLYYLYILYVSKLF